MGDVLHAMPAVAALRELRPEWEIGWAIEPKWRELLAAGKGSLAGRGVRDAVGEWVVCGGYRGLEAAWGFEQLRSQMC